MPLSTSFPRPNRAAFAPDERTHYPIVMNSNHPSEHNHVTGQKIRQGNSDNSFNNTSNIVEKNRQVESNNASSAYHTGAHQVDGPSAASTGSVLRPEKVHAVRFGISDIDSNYREPMHTGAVHPDRFAARFPTDAQGSRRVVYSYEDAFKFSRILHHDDIAFDAHFEGGNLGKAMRVTRKVALPQGAQEYELLMNNDVHSRGHRQWFFFSLSNIRTHIPYVFHITNFAKADSMFNRGMLPLMFSCSKFAKDKIGWHRIGGVRTTWTTFSAQARQQRWPLRSYNDATKASPFRYVSGDCEQICYYQVPDEASDGVRRYILTFSHVFEHPEDLCYIAMCYPYSYADLQIMLNEVLLGPHISSFIFREKLCDTVAGNTCDLLTIAESSPGLRSISKRQAIVLSARVHPGETIASWMMDGVIRFLVSDHTDAQWLRQHYQLKIVPMLNIDGVVNGNYRTSLAGMDLNRRWKHPHPALHPTIFHLKLLIDVLQRTSGVTLFCDFHGHSRQQGIFFYSCPAQARRRSAESSSNGLAVPSKQSINRDPHRNTQSGVSGTTAASISSTNIFQTKLSNLVHTLADDVSNSLVVGVPTSTKAESSADNTENRHSISHSDTDMQWRTISLKSSDPGWRHWSSRHHPQVIRMLPAILSDIDNHLFDYVGCRFSLSRDKLGTARAVVYRELKVPLAYTCEASFCGARGVHYTHSDYQEAGRLCLQGIASLLKGKRICECMELSRIISQTSPDQGPRQRIDQLSAENLLIASFGSLHHTRSTDASCSSNSSPSSSPTTPFQQRNTISKIPIEIPVQDASFMEHFSPTSRNHIQIHTQNAKADADAKAERRWGDIGVKMPSDTTKKDHKNYPSTSVEHSKSGAYYIAAKWIETPDIPSMVEFKNAFNAMLDKSTAACTRVRRITPAIDAQGLRISRRGNSMKSLGKSTSDRDADSGSDECPSDDNLDIDALSKLLRRSGWKQAARELLNADTESEPNNSDTNNVSSHKHRESRRRSSLSESSMLLAPMHRNRAIAMAKANDRGKLRKMSESSLDRRRKQKTLSHQYDTSNQGYHDSYMPNRHSTSSVDMTSLLRKNTPETGYVSDVSLSRETSTRSSFELDSTDSCHPSNEQRTVHSSRSVKLSRQYETSSYRGINASPQPTGGLPPRRPLHRRPSRSSSATRAHLPNVHPERFSKDEKVTNRRGSLSARACYSVQDEYHFPALKSLDSVASFPESKPSNSTASLIVPSEKEIDSLSVFMDQSFRVSSESVRILQSSNSSISSNIQQSITKSKDQISLHSSPAVRNLQLDHSYNTSTKAHARTPQPGARRRKYPHTLKLRSASKSTRP